MPAPREAESAVQDRVLETQVTESDGFLNLTTGLQETGQRIMADNVRDKELTWSATDKIKWVLWGKEREDSI